MGPSWHGLLLKAKINEADLQLLENKDKQRVNSVPLPFAEATLA